MFHTSLNREYQLAQEALGFSDDELRRLARNSFEASFLPESRKREILVSFQDKATTDQHGFHG
jgi:adenosine deaminase